MISNTTKEILALGIVISEIPPLWGGSPLIMVTLFGLKHNRPIPKFGPDKKAFLFIKQETVEYRHEISGDPFHVEYHYTNGFCYVLKYPTKIKKIYVDKYDMTYLFTVCEDPFGVVEFDACKV